MRGKPSATVVLKVPKTRAEVETAYKKVADLYYVLNSFHSLGRDK